MPIINANLQSLTEAFCGHSKHTSNSESYFYTTAYNSQSKLVYQVTSSIIDDHSYNEKLCEQDEVPFCDRLPLPEESCKKKATWECNSYCKLPGVRMLNELKGFFEDLSNLDHIQCFEFLKNIDICLAQRQSGKIGHPISCYTDPLSCKSRFLHLVVTSYHFPYLRAIKDNIYRLKQCCQNIENINRALNETDIAELQKIVSKAKIAVFHCNANYNELLNEQKIKQKHHDGIKIFTDIVEDPPKIPCILCVKLYSRRNLVAAKKFKNTIAVQLGLDVINRNYWKELMHYYGDSEEFLAKSNLCNSCNVKLRNNNLPSKCILNNLYVKETPGCIKELNMIEKILIQRAKAFQVVQKKSTVMKKNLPHYAKIDCVIGTTFHLPLPQDETIKKICPEVNPLNIDHEIYILVWTNPSKSKKIWEQYVDIKKVWNALAWLRDNNPISKN